MNKFIRTFLVALLMLTHTSVFAQLLNVRIGSDALVEEAIHDAVVLVESRYCIQDVETDKKYGRYGKPYFSTVRFLGCKTDKGIITSAQALTPWNVDSQFNNYRNNNKYRPLQDSTLYVRVFPTDTIQAIDISSNFHFNGDSSLVCVGNKSCSANALMLSAEADSATNWIVWLKESKDSESEDSPIFEYNVVKKTIKFVNGEAIIDAPNSANPPFGALYISAKIVCVGMVEFSLSGLALENFRKWVLIPVNNNTFGDINDIEPNAAVSQSPDNLEEGLTPVEDNSKGKKKKSKSSKKK